MTDILPEGRTVREASDRRAPAPDALTGRRVCMLLFNPFTHDARVLREARALVAAGADVRVIARAAAGLPAEETVHGIRVRRLDADPVVSRVVKRAMAGGSGEAVTLPPGPAPAGGPAAALHRVELLARRGLMSWTFLRWYRLAVREALREPVDLVIAHDFETLPPGSAAARRAGARLLYDAHEIAADMALALPRTRLGRRRLMLMEHRLARRANAVVTVSDSMAEVLSERYGIHPAVVRNVPRRRTSAGSSRAWLRNAGVPDEAQVVLYSGGMLEQRGLDAVVQAMAAVPDAWLVFLGPGDPGYIARLRTVADQAGVADRFRIVPPVAPEEVTAHCAAADVGVVAIRPTSLNNWLALPNKVFDYLAAGLPVVTVDFPELQRLVDEHGIGRTYAADDPASLAAAITAVLRQPAELRFNATQAGAQLTWEREQLAYLEAVERALS
jgi:glycosyltransferase involved in cell wall biosynthesis